MAIAELTGDFLNVPRVAADNLKRLHFVAQLDTRKLDSKALELISRIKEFVEWIDDPRPPFSHSKNKSDKFSELVILSKGYIECTIFYSNEVGVNSTTIWRWASGKSIPSKYVGINVCEDIQNLLIDVLSAECRLLGLLGRDD